MSRCRRLLRRSDLRVRRREWWRGEDSNLRRREPADLQSAPFGRFGTSPLVLGVRGPCGLAAPVQSPVRGSWRTAELLGAGRRSPSGEQKKETGTARLVLMTSPSLPRVVSCTRDRPPEILFAISLLREGFRSSRNFSRKGGATVAAVFEVAPPSADFCGFFSDAAHPPRAGCRRRQWSWRGDSNP
jgi:hypothetical protein